MQKNQGVGNVDRGREGGPHTRTTLGPLPTKPRGVEALPHTPQTKNIHQSNKQCMGWVKCTNQKVTVGVVVSDSWGGVLGEGREWRTGKRTNSAHTRTTTGARHTAPAESGQGPGTHVHTTGTSKLTTQRGRGGGVERERAPAGSQGRGGGSPHTTQVPVDTSARERL